MSDADILEMWYSLHPEVLDGDQGTFDDSFEAYAEEVFGFNPLDLPESDWQPYMGQGAAGSFS